MIGLPYDGGGINVKVLDGNAAARIDLVLRSPIQETLVEDANSHHGFTWDTTGFPAGTAFDIGIQWFYYDQSGSEYGCNIQQIDSVTYVLGFEDIGVSPWYVDLIVQVVVHPVNIKVATAGSTLTPLGDHDNKKADATCTVPKGQADTCQRIIDFSKRDTTQVTVTVTGYNGNPVPNYPFTLSAFVRPNSGGHDHNDNRPTGKFITATKDTVASFQATTGSDGKATYVYICSGFGGVDSIFVKGETDKDTSTTTILLQFLGLQELTEGDHYRLIGAHSQGASSQHEKNHYGKSNLISRLKLIADTIYVKKGYELQINDMSLVNGGPLDIDNNWDCPHQTHRNGISVDIRNRLIDGTREFYFPEKAFVDWIKATGLSEGKGFRVREEAGHFHLTIY